MTKSDYSTVDPASLSTYLRRAEMLIEILRTDLSMSERARELGADLAAMRETWPLAEYELPYVHDVNPEGVVDHTGLLRTPLSLQANKSLMLYATFPSDKMFLLRDIVVKVKGVEFVEVCVELFEGKSYKPSASTLGGVRDAWMKYRPRQPIRFGLRAKADSVVRVVVAGYVLGT